MPVYADHVLRGAGISSRNDLIIYATKLARTKNITATKALMMLQEGSVDIEELKNSCISTYQETIPIDEKTDENPST